jgi:iron(III) transport system ATP-binding protein
MNAAGVSIRGVDLSYGSNRVLRDVDLEIEPGEFFAFLGPSGCGKTTLLRAIAGFARPDRGRIAVGGADISALPPWKRDVGMVFQSYALWPHMTVRRNVAFGLEERRLPRSAWGSRRSRTAARRSCPAGNSSVWP